MKKTQLFVILIVVIALFAYADYAMNVPQGISLPEIPQEEVETAGSGPVIVDPNITQAILDGSVIGETYKIEKRSRTTELFELFDLSQISNVSAYSNILIKGAGDLQPIYVYEIQGPEGQGKITYLNIKLKLIDQLGSSAGINETGSYGFNSLFYNDEANPSTGFLLSQIGDTIFGFKYNKAEGNVFDFVKQFVEYYMSEVTN